MSGLLLIALASSMLLLQQMPWQKDNAPAKQEKAQSVQFLYPEQVTVAANKPSQVDLHFRVANGLHINSHTPREKSFIRTELIVVEPPGVNVAAVDFPPGTDYSLTSMPNEKLSVYTGEFVLHARLTARPGEHLVPAELRYQACDTNSCYPPRKAPLAFDIIAK